VNQDSQYQWKPYKTIQQYNTELEVTSALKKYMPQLETYTARSDIRQQFYNLIKF